MGSGEEPMSKLAEEIVQLVDRAIVRSGYGALLGLELVGADEDCVRVRLAFRPEITTYADVVHGGAIAGLVDAAATAAVWASPSIAQGSRGATVGFSLNFTAAGRGQDLTAVARVRRRGREISTVEVSVLDTSGTEVAVALATYKLSVPR